MHCHSDLHSPAWPLPIVVDDTAEDISYRSANGSWTTLFNQDPALGFRDNTMTLSSTKGDSISWTFKGLDVEYWAGTGPDRGPCLIEFDGEPQGEVTGHAAVHGPPTRLFKKSSLDPLVDHTIRIVVSSDKTPNLCDLDKFIYIPVPDKSMTKAIGQPAKHETSLASQQTASYYPSLLTHQEVWILPQLSTFLWTASGSAAGIVIFVLFLFGVCYWPPRYHPRPQKNPTQEQSLLDLRIRVPSTEGSRSLPTEPVPAAPPPPPALPQPKATPDQPATASPVDDAPAESADKATSRLEGPKPQLTNVNGLTAVLAPEGPSPSSSGSNVPTPPLVQKPSSARQLTSQPSTASRYIRCCTRRHLLTVTFAVASNLASSQLKASNLASSQLKASNLASSQLKALELAQVRRSCSSLLVWTRSSTLSELSGTPKEMPT
ncbi:hypothetical protein BKA62DRAFT_101139 [Auriculariales sp. MPI-PUGE-AT-0066]|nr:hypothetical protein BKA62DRAFT_101139 [Auriculariales sp. MPI-PUGE-AT-0066]